MHFPFASTGTVPTSLDDELAAVMPSSVGSQLAAPSSAVSHSLQDSSHGQSEAQSQPQSQPQRASLQDLSHEQLQPPSRRASLPDHPPPPPVSSLFVDPSPTALAAAPVPLSPKTTKLLRRIRKREEEIEALTLENELLKEANRRANEERAVREHERRVEARRRAELDAAREAELEALRARLKEASVEESKHDATECARQIADLTELLQLREEQLELINLDRSKLYEEIETWKIGMERLASLQAGTYRVSSGPNSAAPSPIASATSSPTLAPIQPQVEPPSTTDLETKLTDALNQLHTTPPTPATPSTKPSTPSKAGSLSLTPTNNHAPVVESLWENQHRHPFFGWTPTAYPFMRHPFSADEDGAEPKTFEDFVLPPGWVWDSPWRWDTPIDRDAGGSTNVASKDGPCTDIDANVDEKLARLRCSVGLGKKSLSSSSLLADPSSSSAHTDADGWRYAFNFRLFSWHAEQGRLDTVRRRKWTRRRVWVGEAATEAMLQNAVRAIRASHGKGGATSQLTIDAPTSFAATTDPRPSKERETLAELAKAYSCSASGSSESQAFSMFTSVTPPAVAGQPPPNPSDTSGTARVLAAILQLGGHKPPTPTPTTTVLESTAAPVIAAPTPTKLAPSKPLDDALMAPSPAHVVPAATSNGGGGVIAGLSSFVVNSTSRVAGWVGRRSTTSTVATPAAANESGTSASSVLEPSAPTPPPVCDTPAPLPGASDPSPVCSFCTAPSHTALQYIHPASSMVVPLVSFCRAHYHQCTAHITLEFHLANPDPLPVEEIKRRETYHRTGECEYCASLETYPVQLLHLAPVTDALMTSADAPARCEVLEVRDAWRFCTKHLTPFLKLVQQFQPSATATPSRVASPGASSSSPAAAPSADNRVVSSADGSSNLSPTVTPSAPPRLSSQTSPSVADALARIEDGDL